MNPRLHQELLNNTEALRKLVGPYSTETIVASCATYFFTYSDSRGGKSSSLSSPVRQLFFLLGLMLSTPEPESPKPFGKSEWEKALRLLEEIFYAYAWMFWPTPEELPNLTDEWRGTRDVAMPAFLHYFTTALMASVEQISTRISQYLSPFDDSLRDLAGISASDALGITSWISQALQKQSDELVHAAERTQTRKLTLLGRARLEGWSEERFGEEVRKGEARHDVERMVKGIRDLFIIRLEDIEKQFGSDKAASFWRMFVSKRGEVNNFQYLTERNPAEEKPLFERSEGVALCPLTNALYSAVLRIGEQRLLNSPLKDAFLRKRDKALELEVEAKLRAFFDDSARFFAGVYETPDLHHEHDLIVLWNRRLFVVEAKASPPTEPFRDPDKAFTRIKRAFRSDAGIQKAFDQADRIRQRIDSGEYIELYSDSRDLVIKIAPGDVDQTYLICVTRDDFGALAADLSFLLDKEKVSPYPWVLNVLALESLLDAWTYFNWGPDRLCEYLNVRTKLHGKVFTTDELEVAGCFILHGSLDHLLDPAADRIMLDPTYSDVFDKIYLTKHGGEKVTYEPLKPVLTDMRKGFFGGRENEPAFTQSGVTREARSKQKKANRQSKSYKNKIGRGAPCPCKSGKTYSRCCGKKSSSNKPG